MPGSTVLLAHEGLDAVATISGRLHDGDWDRPACGTWTATDVAHHLVAVVEWYDEWLDRAVAGDFSVPFAEKELAERNEEAVARLASVDPTEAINCFQTAAALYVARAGEHLELPYGFPFGTATVGLHLGAAAAEWHLHAWDLSGVRGPRHAPDDAGALFIAAGRCLAAATGGVRGRLLGRLVPLGAKRSPWPTLLRRSGRRP